MGCLDKLLVRQGLAQSRLEGLFGAVRQAGNPGSGMGQGAGSQGTGGPEAMVAVMEMELVWEEVEKFLLPEAEREHSVLIQDRS